MFILPLAIIGRVGNLVIDRLMLKKHWLTYQLYIVGIFTFLALFSVLSLPWLGRFVSPPSLAGFGWLALVVLTACGWNYFYAQALAKEHLEEMESFMLFVPLVAALLAFMVFPADRNWTVFGATLVAGAAFLFSHLKKSHLQLHQPEHYLVLTVLLYSAELILDRVALNYFSPALLYSLRCLLILLVFTLIFKPKIHQIAPKTKRWLALSGLLGALYMVAQYTGFAHYGVTYTVLVLMVAPFASLTLDRFWLKGQLHWRYLVSITIIVGAIIWATLAQ